MMRITQEWSGGDLMLLRASEPKQVEIFHFSEHTTLRFSDGNRRFPEVDVALLNDVARLLYEQLKPLFEGSSDG